MQKKNGCHQPENQFPPARTSFAQQEYFLKIGFRLISIMVFTSRNKNCKILFCLGEIVFIFCQWKPLLKLCGSQFLKKNLIAPSRNYFCGCRETVSSICEIFLAVKTVFSEFFILPCENRFSVYWKQNSFIQSFVEVFGSREQQLFLRGSLFLLVKTDFLASESCFFFHFLDTPAC